jgi:hypothetical protein
MSPMIMVVEWGYLFVFLTHYPVTKYMVTIYVCYFLLWGQQFLK